MIDQQYTETTCPKCNGTGFFALYILDGRPVSNTGHTCWKCNGTGKVRRKRRRTKAQKAQDSANANIHFTIDGDLHTYCKSQPRECVYCGEIHTR